jgi:hypothetical protein
LNIFSKEEKKQTIEDRVGNQTAGIDDFTIIGDRDGFAVTIFQVINSSDLSQELIRIEALNVSPVVLEEVREPVVEENGGIEVIRDLKADTALSRGDRAGRAILVLHKSVLGRRERCRRI